MDTHSPIAWPGIEYSDLLKSRAREYTAAVDAMGPTPPALDAWVGRMSRRYGPELMVTANRCGWIVALLLVLYGEDAAKWPATYTPLMATRAGTWEAGKTPVMPARVRYIGLPDLT